MTKQTEASSAGVTLFTVSYYLSWPFLAFGIFGLVVETMAYMNLKSPTDDQVNRFLYGFLLAIGIISVGVLILFLAYLYCKSKLDISGWRILANKKYMFIGEIVEDLALKNIKRLESNEPAVLNGTESKSSQQQRGEN